MRNVALFCASSSCIDSIYTDEAARLGQWLGIHRKRLIYGGSNRGLMEVTAKAAKENGASVTGVITTSLKQNGRASTLPDEWVEVATLSQRKQWMIDHADLFVVLPGGIGTLDELFDVLAAAQLDIHSKPVIICNINGIYDTLIQLLQSLVSAHFSPPCSVDYFQVASTIDECIVQITEQENKSHGIKQN